MIEFNDVHIYYGDNHIIKGVSFKVGKGEIFGIIGPNGAGKTTLLRALTGMIIPDKGKVLINGKEIGSIPSKDRKIAYLFESARGGSFLRLTAEEDLEFYAALYNVDVDRDYIHRVLKIVGLYEERKKKLYTYSRGMWQKLYLARVILPDFPIIVLDEPWLGLDVVSQRESIKLLKNLRESGKTIVLTAHEMPLIERSCTKILILKNGEKVLEGSPSELYASIGWKYKVIINSENGEKVIYIRDIHALIEHLQNSEIYDTHIVPLSIEDIYLKMVGDLND